MRRSLFEAALYMAQRWREEPLWSVCERGHDDEPRGHRPMRDGGWECADEMSGEFEAR